MKTTLPLVTIIIPTFNSGTTLPACLNSLVRQTYPNIQVLIIDGLSTDNTSDIAKDYYNKWPFIRWYSEKDRGIYDAMNKGLDMAEGEWHIFMGSDDQLYSDTILEQVFAKMPEPAANVMYGNVSIVGKTSWAEDGMIYDGVFDIKKLLNKNICHQAIFYRTEFVRKEIGLYNIDYRLCADWDFNLRCRAKTPFHYLDLIIARFYAGGESTRIQTDEKFTNEYLQNILTYFNLSPFDKIVNDPSFIDYYKLTFLQRKANFIRYLINKVQRKLFRKR